MLRKLEYVCLVASIGLIGADRIDLAVGHLPFALTPFLALASLVLLLHLVRTPPNQLLRLSITPPVRRQLPFVVASSLFLMFCFASIPVGLDPERSLVAFCDLVVVAVLGYCISLLILAEPAQERLIVRSVTFALVVYVIFCIGECIAWSHGIGLNTDRTAWLESTFGPSMIGPWFPTMAGTTFDSNRSGFVLTIYLALLDRYAAKSRYMPVFRFAIGLLVLLTISRSGALCWSAYYLSSRKFWTRLASRRVLARMAAIAIIASFLFVVYRKEIGRAHV